MTTHDDLLHAAALAQAEHPGLFAEKMLAAVEPIIRADERKHLIECIETAGCGICGKSYTQIEAEVRERIAQEIGARERLVNDAYRLNRESYYEGYRDALDIAESIARGGESDGT